MRDQRCDHAELTTSSGAVRYRANGSDTWPPISADRRHLGWLAVGGVANETRLSGGSQVLTAQPTGARSIERSTSAI